MPHIHTQPGQHDHTVSAYIIRADTPEPQSLLHMHKKHNILLQVGGHIELDESPWQAVAHELEEESGYTLDDLWVLQPKLRIRHLSKITLHPYPVVMNTHCIDSGHFHTDTAYAFVAKSGPKLAISENESTDLRWLTQTEINALSEAEIYADNKEIYNFVFDTCLKEWEQVPATNFKI